MAQCEVVSSRVITDRNEDGIDYLPDILYEYTFRGIVYRSNRYDIVMISIADLAAVKAIVAKYPPGRRTHCWVNPHDANQAVLDREVPGDIFWGIIPAFFMFLCAGGIICGIALIIRDDDDSKMAAENSIGAPEFDS